MKLSSKLFRTVVEDGMDAHVRRIGDTLAEVFARADAENLPTSVIADRVAEAKFKR